jgi:hypothetical protein
MGVSSTSVFPGVDPIGGIQINQLTIINEFFKFIVLLHESATPPLFSRILVMRLKSFPRIQFSLGFSCLYQSRKLRRLVF